MKRKVTNMKYNSALLLFGNNNYLQAKCLFIGKV